jgi:hypothetical protein
MNEWSVGSAQILNFTGTAVHGGGSCQLSVTADKIPSPASVWKVIHSIEGGCPSSAGANLKEDDSEGGPSQFPFTVPKELPNGEMTVAWTWFNKVGNREMYMNCAPITVSGGSDDTSGFDALPDMAVANIQGQGTCHTSETYDYIFANPGKYVTKGGEGPYMPLCGGAPSGSSGMPLQPPVQSPASPPVESPAPTPDLSQTLAPISEPAAPTSPIAASTLHTMVTITSVTSPSTSSSTATANPSPIASANPKAPAFPSKTPALAPAPSTGPTNGPTCSPNGTLVCNGETQFGLCNWGTVVWQPVAAGTKCQDGKIARRAYTHRAQRTGV